MTTLAEATAKAIARRREEREREAAEVLLKHAQRTGDKNLAVLCKVYLDPTSDGARKYAEQRIRAYLDGKGASL